MEGVGSVVWSVRECESVGACVSFCCVLTCYSESMNSTVAFVSILVPNNLISEFITIRHYVRTTWEKHPCITLRSDINDT